MSTRRCRLVVGVCLLVGVVVTGSRPAAGAAARCAAGRYLVKGRSLLSSARPATGATRDAETTRGKVILLAGDRISIADLCPPTSAEFVETRRGTRVKARWPHCDGVQGAVRLVGTVGGEGCRSFAGRIRSRDRGLRRRFHAAFSLVGTADCGDEGTFDHIQRRIFGPRGCRVQTCHGAAAAGGLDLRLGVAHDALVDVPATNAVAAADGKRRVVPGSPETSFLFQKLAAEVRAGEGAPMPAVGRPLDALELELIRTWIAGGAPASGRVPGAPCLPPETFTPAPALAPPSDGYQMVLEGPTLEPGQEIEGCMWVRVPNDADFAVGTWEMSLNPGTHHFAVWEHVYGASPELNVFRRDTACISGGARFDGVTIAAAPSAPYYVEAHPAGVGQIVKGGSIVGLNPHYHNEYDVPVQIKVWINMHPVVGPLRHLSEALISSSGTLNGKNPYSISVPPFTTGTLRIRYGPTDRSWSIFRLTSHQHQRGTRFTAWRSDGTKLFENLDWSHPAILDFDPPFVLAPGDYIEYECEHDNGVTRPVRRCGDSPYDTGCTAGDPVTLRFGLTSVDEMCLLAGQYYEE